MMIDKFALAALQILLASSTVASTASCALSNYDPSAGYFVEVILTAELGERTIQRADPLLILIRIDDQEREVSGIVCRNEAGDLVAGDVSAEELEAMGDAASFFAAANLDECETQSIARAEVWSTEGTGCPASSSAAQGLVPIEELFHTERSVDPEEQVCSAPIQHAIYDTIGAGPGIPDPLELELDDSAEAQ